jgi:hypothetical protein
MKPLSKIDQRWLVFYFLMSIFTLFVILKKLDPWGEFYWNFFIFGAMGIGFSIFASNLFRFKNLEPTKIKEKIFWGWAIGLAATSSIWLGSQLFGFFQIVSAPSAALLGFAGTETLFLLSFATGDIEETFRALIRQSAIAQFADRQGAALVVFAAISVFMYFVVAAKFFAFVVAAYIVLALVNKQMAKFIQNRTVSRGAGIFFAAGIFGIFHLFSPGADIWAAFIFAVIVDSINEFYGDTLVGRIAHVINNAGVGVIALGIPVYYMFVIGGFYTFIYYVIIHGFKGVKLPS